MAGNVNSDLTRLNIRFRFALQASTPRPTKAEIDVSVGLHGVLTKASIMRPVPQAGSDVLIPAREEEVKVLGLPQFFPIEHEGQEIRVAIFPKLLYPAQASSECTICFETKPTRDLRSVIAVLNSSRGSNAKELLQALSGFPSIDEVGRHTHLLDFCRDCLATYLSHEVSIHRDTIHEHIRCPVEDCKEDLDESQLKKYLGAGETIKRYDRLSLLQFISTEEDFRWCLTPGCDYGAIWHISESCSMLSCPVCETSQCYYHKVPWRMHAGMTCAQYDRKVRDPESYAWLDRQTRACPRCKVRISKGPGCFHMTCTQCQYEFCWECSAKGCFFNGASVMTTEVFGETLQDGIEALLEQARDDQAREEEEEEDAAPDRAAPGGDVVVEEHQVDDDDVEEDDVEEDEIALSPVDRLEGGPTGWDEGDWFGDWLIRFD
ncbi:hypothetical protein SLS62_005183 [Diatrype stigma]|uniref:RBR-type E3 ubiquitin transferase n=1 Tax=Diatrype stigma TaxID=117547 RepID=A0AAN9YPW5_9PEZI